MGKAAGSLGRCPLDTEAPWKIVVAGRVAGSPTWDSVGQTELQDKLDVKHSL